MTTKRKPRKVEVKGNYPRLSGWRENYINIKEIAGYFDNNQEKAVLDEINEAVSIYRIRKRATSEPPKCTQLDDARQLQETIAELLIRLEKIPSGIKPSLLDYSSKLKPLLDEFYSVIDWIMGEYEAKDPRRTKPSAYARDALIREAGSIYRKYKDRYGEKYRREDVETFVAYVLEVVKETAPYRLDQILKKV